MARNTFATIGILAVLLLSLTVVSAANGFELNVVDDLPATIVLGDEYTVKVNFNNTNITYDAVNVSFEGADATIWTLIPANKAVLKSSDEDFTAKITIPLDATGSHAKQLRAYYYNGSEELSYVTASFMVNSPNPDPILGCTDDTYDNYDPDATEDDGTCSNDPVVPTQGCKTAGDANYTNADVHNPALCTGVPLTGTWCSQDYSGEKGTLQIKNFYIDYTGSGDDEEWEALDEVTIEVDVKNTDTDDRVDDVLVEIRILDTANNDVTSDFDFEDEEDNLGRISKKSTETAIFTIKEIPTDVEDGRYNIQVIAYDEGDETLQCVSISDDFNDDSKLFHEIDVVREDEAVIVKDSDLLEGTISASCGDEDIEVSFPVYNLGEDEEDKVLVQLYNRDLGIDKLYVIDSLRSGKGKQATFFIDLPEELSQDRYSLDIYTFFAYDEDEDELSKAAYDENSNDIDRDFTLRLEVLSCKGPAPTIAATLDSETAIGTELIITATITNNGEDNDFVVSAADFESWAELVSVVPQTASIDEGDSTEVIITLMPTKAGTQSFNINAIVDGESHEQAVSVSIPGDEDTGIFSGISNATLYTIIIIAAVLILIFLALIVRISRRTAKPQF